MNATPSSPAAKPESNSENLEAQVRALRADLSKLADTVGTIGRGKAEEFRSKAAGHAEDVKHAAGDALHAAQRHARQFEDDFVERVRERPLTALGIAVGVGFVVAWLCRR